MASRAILLNFFEEQWIQNHVWGLSRTPFPTTFLEIAVYSTAVVLRTYVSLYYSSPHILTVILVGNEQFIKMCMANAFS